MTGAIGPNVRDLPTKEVCWQCVAGGYRGHTCEAVTVHYDPTARLGAGSKPKSSKGSCIG